MSEQVPSKPEHQEALAMPKLPERLPDAAHAEALRAGEKDPLQDLTEARTSVSETVQDTKANLFANPAEQTNEPLPRQAVNRELKQITLRRELNGIRRQLPAPQRALSRAIHQPVVRAISEAASNTVSRPAGLLGGGLVAFLGTSSYLYLAKHLGFDYNYAVFLLLFAGGFVVGLGLELLVHLATASRRRAVE